MAFPVAAFIGGSLISGLLGKKAGDAQADASEAAVAEQRRQFDLTRQDYAPYLGMGQNALADISKEFGYPAFTPQATAPTSSGPTYSGDGLFASLLRKMQESQPQPEGQPAAAPAYAGTGFSASPDYAFRRGEGMRDIGNYFGAKGGAFSGNALKALNEFNSGLASSEYGNWFNRRAGLAGVGQTATNAVGSFGAGSSENIGNAMMAGGNARASGLANVNNAVQGGLSNWLLWKQMQGG